MNNTPIYPTYLKAILALSPNAEIKGIGENLDSLVWAKNPDYITNEQIETKLTELQADYDSKQYQRDRLTEYPSIQELVVALYDEEDKQAIIERRNAVKAKYPKPE